MRHILILIRDEDDKVVVDAEFSPPPPDDPAARSPAQRLADEILTDLREKYGDAGE